MSELTFPDYLPTGWRQKLASEKDKDYFKSLSKFLIQEYKSGKQIYPERKNILKALQLLDINDVKVVILGQDPYHGDGQAVGLSFAVPNELRLKPPSLQNIFKEIESDCGVVLQKQNSDLSGWVKQGVLLLNTVLTVRANQAFSHREKGWEQFTDQVIEHLSNRKQPIVFLLWGAAAQKKKTKIASHHYVLESVHPSPLSAHRGFLGCKHFSRTNEILKKLGQQEVDWSCLSQP